MIADKSTKINPAISAYLPALSGVIIKRLVDIIFANTRPMNIKNLTLIMYGV